MSYKRLSYTVENQIAQIGFGYNCDRSMTTLDEETLQELDQIADDLKAKGKSKHIVGALFFSHKERCFLAGADIKLIASMKTESEGSYGAERGQQILNKIEDLKINTVACVHGVCLGGGLEVALSCNEIICSDSKETQLGLPEVKLGLIPGFGGTYRLPRKVGLPKSLDLILTGKSVKGKKAKRLGLVGGIYPKERILKMGLQHLEGNRKKATFKESLENLASENFLARKIIFQKARDTVLKKTKGFYMAPLKILDTMEGAMSKGRTGYLSSEAQAFGELCISEQSRNLQHIYFLTEGTKKYHGPEGEGKTPKIGRTAILGAGTMGGGIAWLMAKNDFRPIMKDLNKDALELGLKQSSRNFMEIVKKKRMSFEEFERYQHSICPRMDYRGFKRTDLVVEAIIENLEIKKKTYTELEENIGADCILATNTSSLRVEDLAENLKYPERFAGLHFFNPVNKMPLVEVVSHSRVAPETLKALYEWCLKVKKTPVLVKDGPGFLVNRILIPYLNESAYLLEEGISVKDLDEACENFGMPMGPCRLIDEIGIDVCDKVGTILHQGLGDRVRPSSINKKLVEVGCLGKKNSKGLYLYDEKGRDTEVNEQDLSFLPLQKKQMEEVEIQMRVFIPMINEAASILRDEIVSTANEIDLALIYGIGFPPFRGGLLRYADEEGPERIYKALCRFRDNVSPERYGPDPYFTELIEKKKKFYDI